MLKHLLVASICLLYLVSGLAGTILAKTANTAKTSSIIYTTGDWVVPDAQVRENETIVLTGNLTVQSGGSLTLRNITLIMNSTAGGSAIEDFYHIEVQQGGTMYILDLDSDNSTINGASNITLNNPAAYYWFWVRDGSNFTMKNSELHQCGGWSVNSGGAGLMVYTDNATIDHNLISDNRYGIVLYGSDAVVSNNTIEWCEYGIRATSWSNGTIENNYIAWSDTCGIRIDGWDNTVKRSSNPLVRNNTIMKTGRDALNKGDAISIQYYSSPVILDTYVFDWGEDGIYIGQECHPTIESCVFDGQDGNYGVATSSPGIVRMTNSTIVNTGNISLATAFLILTNCTFNHSKVIFQGTDSNLTVNWFFNTYVNDSFSNSVSNANIRIRDNENGTFDENVTTDNNGFLNWTVLREYFQKDINGDKDGNDPGERIDYGPYNLTVSKPDYKTAYASVWMNESKSITITLEANETVSDPYPIYGYAYLYDGTGGVYNPLPLINAQVEITWWNVWLNDWQTITTNTIGTGQYSVDIMNYTNGGVVFCNATAPAPFNNQGYNWTVVDVAGAPGGRQQNIVCGVPYDMVITNYPLAVPVNSPFGITYEIQDIDGLRSQGYFTFFDGPVNISANGSYSAPGNYLFNGLASGTPGTRTETVTLGLPLGQRWLNVSEGPDLNPYLTPWGAFNHWNGTAGFLKDWDNVTINVTGAGFLWRLEQGWNLICVPASPVQKGGNGIFDSYDALNITYAITGDPDMSIADRIGGIPSAYNIFDIGMPENLAFPMDGVHGYWLYLSVPGPFVVSVIAQNYSVAGANVANLAVGWNLMGFTHNVSGGGAQPGGWNSALSASHFTNGNVDSDLNVPPRNKLVITWWNPIVQWYHSYVVTPTFPGMPTHDWAYDTTYAYGYWVWTDAAMQVTFDTDY